MWLFTTCGFFSVVRKGDEFHVRARKREHLDNLIRLAGRRDEIHAWRGADYPYRIVVDEKAWKGIAEHLAREVSYPNFKSAAGARLDRATVARLHQVWATMAELGCGLGLPRPYQAH